MHSDFGIDFIKVELPRSKVERFQLSYDFQSMITFPYIMSRRIYFVLLFRQKEYVESIPP
jgi:hypothetical protein